MLKRVLWCGEVLSTPTLIYWMRKLPHVAFTNLYGPTEATIASSYHTVPACPKDDRSTIPIGTPCDGEALLVLDGELKAMPPGEIGELYIAGAGLSPGYWRDPAKTSAAFIERAGADGLPERIYRTGDLAKAGEDGLTYFVGRADTQVKCRGYRVELGEVESALQTVKGVAEQAVVAVDTGGFEGAILCCAFVAKPGETLTAASLRTELSRLLPSYMLPSRWMQLDALPKNANGKIDRPLLKERFKPHGTATS
jgi:acyl-coenzyme A synthetase/AMP-(fatty) acid ligase